MNDALALFDTYSRAVFNKEVDTFLSIFDDSLLVFDMWEPWIYEGLASWREMTEEWFGSLGTDRVVVSFHDIRLDVLGEIATATSIVRFAAVNEKNEEIRFLQNRLTWIIRQKRGGWKISHQHTSAPINPETMKASLRLPS